MADKSSDLVQGTLDMLILKTLALEPMHGFGVAVRIEQISRGVFRVNAGSLFVAFQRLQRAGLIRSEWKATENNRRAKYYTLTELGRKKLSNETVCVTRRIETGTSSGNAHDFHNLRLAFRSRPHPAAPQGSDRRDSWHHHRMV